MVDSLISIITIYTAHHLIIMPKKKNRRGRNNQHAHIDPIEKYLTELYNTPGGAGSFGGVKPLLDEIKREGKYDIGKKRVVEFLKGRDEYTLHKPARKVYPTHHILVGGPNDMHQGDLIDFNTISKHNDGYSYILTVIDCFTRFAWAVPIKDKVPATVVAALKIVYGGLDTPSNFVSDAGREFTGNATRDWFKERDIHFAIAYGTHKAQFVERFNLTFKRMLFRSLTLTHTLRYIDRVDDTVRAYNSRFHRSIGMRPIDVNSDNAKSIFIHMYGDPKNWMVRQGGDGYYKRGDHVRISRLKGPFEKSYEESYSREVYVVNKVLATEPVQYKLNSLNGEKINGRFYKEEMTHVRMNPDTVYPIEKVLDHRVVGGVKQALVKWKGWNSSYNQWINEAELKGINT